MHDGRMQSKKEGKSAISLFDPLAGTEPPTPEYQYNHISSSRRKKWTSQNTNVIAQRTVSIRTIPDRPAARWSPAGDSGHDTGITRQRAGTGAVVSWPPLQHLQVVDDRLFESHGGFLSEGVKMIAETVMDGAASEDNPMRGNPCPRHRAVPTAWNHQNILLFSEKESKRTDFEMVVPKRC